MVGPQSAAKSMYIGAPTLHAVCGKSKELHMLTRAKSTLRETASQNAHSMDDWRVSVMLALSRFACVAAFKPSAAVVFIVHTTRDKHTCPTKRLRPVSGKCCDATTRQRARTFDRKAGTDNPSAILIGVRHSTGRHLKAKSQRPSRSRQRGYPQVPH